MHQCLGNPLSVLLAAFTLITSLLDLQQEEDPHELLHCVGAQDLMSWHLTKDSLHALGEVFLLVEGLVHGVTQNGAQRGFLQVDQGVQDLTVQGVDGCAEGGKLHNVKLRERFVPIDKAVDLIGVDPPLKNLISKDVPESVLIHRRRPVLNLLKL